MLQVIRVVRPSVLSLKNVFIVGLPDVNVIFCTLVVTHAETFRNIFMVIVSRLDIGSRVLLCEYSSLASPVSSDEILLETYAHSAAFLFITDVGGTSRRVKGGCRS